MKLYNVVVLAILSLISDRLFAGDVTPISDTQVIERLSPRLVKVAPTLSPRAAAQSAQDAISTARRTSDPRHLGRAEALLQPWWNVEAAPIDIMVLQATIEQSQHEFRAARTTLDRAVKRDPQNAQAWLTLASLNRLEAKYADALSACGKINQAQTQAYAIACRAETESLQGQHDTARRRFVALMRQLPNDSARAWALSLQAENEERSGDLAAAQAAYRESLALAPDPYTAVALADLQLRSGNPREAIVTLANQTESDGVLIRRAYAFKLTNDPQLRVLVVSLKGRLNAMHQRDAQPSESNTAHARELALFQLWIEEDYAKASEFAQQNLTLQREPIDWWLALETAERAGERSVLSSTRQSLVQSGLRDSRLKRWQ